MPEISPNVTSRPTIQNNKTILLFILLGFQFLVIVLFSYAFQGNQNSILSTPVAAPTEVNVQYYHKPSPTSPAVPVPPPATPEKKKENPVPIPIPPPKPEPPKKPRKKLHLVIDGLIFDLQSKPRGVSQVWLNLIPQFTKLMVGMGNKVTVLQRGRDLNQFFGALKAEGLRIQRLAHSLEGETQILANEDKGEYEMVFTSSYYSHAQGFCNLLVVYDCIPENTGMAHGPGTEYYPRIEGIKGWANSIASIAPSTTRDTVRLYNIPENIIVTSHTRIDPSYKPVSAEKLADFRNRFGINPSKPYFLIVGMRWSFKNSITFWKALNRLTPAEKKEVQVLLVGNGDYEHAIHGEGGLLPEEKPYAQGLFDIISIGHVTQQDMAACFSGAHANVYIALYEGFGMPVPEGMASGATAIISNSWGNIPDNAAWKVNPRSEDEVYNAIKESLEKPEVLKQKRLGALEAAKYFGADPKHGWNEMASDIINHLYDGPKRGNNCHI